MFEIDTGIKQEALNYATIMNVLGYSEHRLEPLFDKLAHEIDVSAPLDNENIQKDYAAYFHVDADTIRQEYAAAFRAFSKLRPDDEIVKRDALNYPSLLKETAQAPRFLYVRGRESLLYEVRTVAVIGSRQASENAKRNTRYLAKKLGENGLVVVSGLARGIDVTAHTEALRHGFHTIAVIGTNLNQYYPSEHESIQREIEERGLVISQFSPAAKTQRWFFPLRNGVMSGLSLASVIMEAGDSSGALKQADFALKQGRQVIIPKNLLFQGTVSWPQEYVNKGAFVVEKPSDVLRVLGENSFFRNRREARPVQRTLEQYMNDLHQTRAFSQGPVWNGPIKAEIAP